FFLFFLFLWKKTFYYFNILFFVVFSLASLVLTCGFFPVLVLFFRKTQFSLPPSGPLGIFQKIHFFFFFWVFPWWWFFNIFLQRYCPFLDGGLALLLSFPRWGGGFFWGPNGRGAGGGGG
ncbi:hypothetical protein, partial [Limosilactobacillus reuteri]|uniref:hypothetical protein n=1 Tax=Limosilactobacillus reuteri TaxID=1598 RepID=UPI001CDABAE5